MNAPGSAALLPGQGGAPGEWRAVLDLSRGAYRARDAALQLAEALEAPLAPVDSLYDDDDPELIGRGVDAEARGPLPVLVGYRDALTLRDALPKGARLGVILDPARPPEDENHWFLVYLARLGVRVEHLPLPACGVTVTGALDPVQSALLALFPGRLPPALAAKAGLDGTGGLYLPGYPGVIAPEWRNLSAAEGRLTGLETADARLRLLCQMRGPAYYADAGWLAEQAMGVFRAGAAGLALRMLERACDVAVGPEERSTAELSLQGLRIFSHCYGAAARHPDPPADLPQAVRDQLSVLKAWAEMFGAAPEAGLARIETAFAKAAQAERPGTEDLFILNIAALGQLRTGRKDAALGTELRIEHALADADEIDHRAEFINAINLSRLYRGRDDRAGFRAQLDRAMATSEGLRNLSDIVQMNLMRAFPGGSDEPAAHHVLRAALAWLALDPPEALAIRALRQACPGAARGPDMVAQVSGALAARMESAWPHIAACRAEGARFSLVDGRAPTGSLAVFAPAAAVLLLPQNIPDVSCQAPCAARARLGGLVLGALARQCPALAGIEAPHLGVDCEAGRDIPAGAQGLRGLIVRHGVKRSLGLAGETLWPRDRRRALAQGARVRLSDGVARLTDHGSAKIVVYKRYRPPCLIDGAGAALLAKLGRDGEGAGALAARAGLAPAAAQEALTGLLERRVVRMEVQDA